VPQETVASPPVDAQAEAGPVPAEAETVEAKAGTVPAETELVKAEPVEVEPVEAEAGTVAAEPAEAGAGTVAAEPVATQPVQTEAVAEPGPSGGGWRMPWRSPAGQPGWARPALLMITAVALVVHGWDVHRMQLHLYYETAVKSMSSNWTAFLYGTVDPAATLTMDKVPGVFWVQALSARLFGFSSWSVLLPQLLAGAVTILVLYRVVRPGPGRQPVSSRRPSTLARRSSPRWPVPRFPTSCWSC